ncbi:MAG: hypothetical protein GX892_01485 [Thermoanaerobacteraceae bacterium]|nr:hypothetical protein [Thermoanaerobacteraceae bacterium]
MAVLNGDSGIGGGHIGTYVLSSINSLKGAYKNLKRLNKPLIMLARY